ncbi:Vms1/Ankzf1 family peptidyl-tRNA hydrolase [Leucobacter massiliensis]|uniref:Peptide chain release factor 1 n=1 Tax=Leucobacter massiliensis TaxID=1686285 RepID=A0A2S9QR61_9MICO|nr:Vms1/Ankzf1 family peptidyl-tRNA hydrolase [Leucobacter massiliensis]PRI12071.1 hypothetical protein B4915_03135 [Leucobacter massiliensis]
MDLQFLRPLYETDAPVATVYLDTSRDSHDAARRIEVRWRSLRRSLSEQGAEEVTLAALDEAVGGGEHIPGPQGEALFAAEGRLLGAYTLAQPPAFDTATHGPVADPLVLAIDYDHQLPYVVVAIDRAGADVDGYPAVSAQPSFQRSFAGSTWHLTKVRGGAEAQATYHRRSENLWSENAAQTAADIRAAIDAVSAEVVFVAGDPKAIGMLREHLGERLLEDRVVFVHGGRADEGSLATLRESVDAGMDVAMRQSHRAVLDAFEAKLAGGLALQGMPAVMEALSEGRVETLLLAADRDQDPELYALRDEPIALGTAPTSFGEGAESFSAPAAALLLRSAAFGDAAFTEILPPEGAERTPIEDGVAAILRY